MTRATDESRPFSERALWASLAFELLGKAALCKLNPALIADPIDDGKSLLLSSGIGSDYSNFKSIPAKAVFSRCARAFRPFNAVAAGRIAGDRNAELHSAMLPYAIAKEDSHWQDFWSQTVILLAALDRELEDLVGSSHVHEVERFLARKAEANAHRVTALVERAKQRYELIAAGSFTTKMSSELPGATYFLQDFSEATTCPACGLYGELTGDYIEDAEDLYEDEGTVMEIVTVASDNFSCSHCGLTLAGEELIGLANLPLSFQVEQEKKIELEEYQNE